MPQADPEQLSELEGKIAIYEIELLELRARLEDVVDREFADLRESELKQEIERLGAELASGNTAGADEQLAPLRDALMAAQDGRDQATARASELAARVDVLESEREQRESELKREIERLGAEAAAGAAGAEELTALRAELEAAQAERAAGRRARCRAGGRPRRARERAEG